MVLGRLNHHLRDYILATVPRTEEVTDSRQDLFYCTHTPLVLVSNNSDVGPVDRWVRLNNKTPELLPPCAVFISKDDSKAYRRHVSIGSNSITRKHSVLAKIQEAHISHE
jgi:hypothetical protein